jgi:uncharacterized protein
MDGAVLLLPPSEGKAGGGRGRFRPGSGRFRGLGAARQEVISGLAGAPDRAFGASGELLDRARAARDALAAGRSPVLPAWQRFTGVVWEHLDPATLGADDLDRILVPSGLLGLCVGTDPVPDFRLKMSVSLPGMGRLGPWWRPSVTAAVRRFAAGRPVVDLLPAEHAAAIDWDRIGAVTHVRFEDGRGSAVGHNAKAVKGTFARAVLLDGLPKAARLSWAGWSAGWEDGSIVVRG